MAPWSGEKGSKSLTPESKNSSTVLLAYAFMFLSTTWLVALTYHVYNTNTLEATPKRLAELSHSAAGLSPFRTTTTTPQSVFFGPDVSYLEGLATCESFKCVREAHDLPRGLPSSSHASQSSGQDTSLPQFNWPHFFIAGYSKSATTSLYVYLNKHPQTSPPVTKGT
jgi:hypothetical protein